MPPFVPADTDEMPPRRYRWLGFATHTLLVASVSSGICGLGFLAEFVRYLVSHETTIWPGDTPALSYLGLWVGLWLIGGGLTGMVVRDILIALRDIAQNSFAPLLIDSNATQGATTNPPPPDQDPPK